MRLDIHRIYALNRGMRLAIFLLAIPLLSSCSHQAPPIVPHSIPSPEPASSNTFSIQPKRVLRDRSRDSFTFAWKERSFEIAYSAAIGVPEEMKIYNFAPVIWVKEGNKPLRVLDLREKFASHCVAGVFQSEAAKRILLALETCMAGPGDSYQILISEDGGNTWFLGAPLSRPPGTHPRAELRDLFMDRNGNGIAWFERSTDFPLKPESRVENQAGHTHFFKATTANGGRSWKVNSQVEFTNDLSEVKASKK